MLSSRGPIAVLIVEHSDVVRDRLNELLTGLHGVAIVGQAADANKGKELAEQLKPDAIVLDVRTPDGKGMDLLRAIKRIHPAPCAVVLTDDTYPENRQMCLDNGADFFFDKSTEFQSVVSLLASLAHQPGTR